MFLEPHRADVAQRGVKSAVVVERQPFDHFVHRLALCGEALAVQPAHLQAAPRALGGRIVPAVALAGHRGLHAVARQRGLERVTAVLGEFNPSSQHIQNGGVDDAEVVEIESIVATQASVAWQAAGTASRRGVPVAIQAYFTAKPLQSTPSLFLGCRAPS